MDFGGNVYRDPHPAPACLLPPPPPLLLMLAISLLKEPSCDQLVTSIRPSSSHFAMTI